MKKIITLASIACCLAFVATAQEKTASQKTISVTGTAEEEVVPDEIYVQVDLREYDKRGVGKVDIDTIKSNFLDACKRIGLGENEVSLQGMAGDDNYWQYRKNRKKDPDMKASASYWIKVSSTQKLDELVDKLDDEATQNFSIVKTAYSKERELKKQLKIDAIKAARAKAIYLSEAIDEHIGEAITITDGEDTDDIFHPIYYANELRENKPPDMPVNVGFKKIKFQFHVNAVFALK
jgi:uncharacterized protein YggE